MLKLGIVESRYQYTLQIKLQHYAIMISSSFQDPPLRATVYICELEQLLLARDSCLYSSQYWMRTKRAFVDMAFIDSKYFDRLIG
jgi:hypothetical protein